MSEEQRKHHVCEIVTLKDQYHGQFQPPKKGAILFSQHVSALQYHDSDGYYKESCNEGQRAVVPVVNGKPGIFDIATSPSGETKYIQLCFLAIIREGLINDINAYQFLIDEMLKDAKITEEEYKKIKVELWDVAEYLLAPKQ